ncbi:MAG: guanylate kinase [Gammaproteobacteria bacterium]|nr:guanylate kinase [Gammaproteobacteria bacterium]
MTRTGNLIVISSPSGGGKTTLVRALAGADPDLRVSVSHTTRPRRNGEQDGVAYHFVDEPAFKKLIAANAFLEHACVFDHYYGTSKRWVNEQLAGGVDVILEIDWQGARQIRGMFPDAVSIFILPPSLALLEQRLRGRGDGDAVVARRMQDARSELSHYREYEYLVVNADLAQARADLHAIVHAARLSYRLHSATLDAHVAEMLR